MENPSSELENPDEKRRHIRKAFGLLKNHAAAVANFTLQWQDLEDHLQSIQNSIQATLFHLQNPTTDPDPDPEPKPPPSHFHGIPIRDGEMLLVHLKDRVKVHASLRDEVCAALDAAEDPGALVLAAIARFFPKKSRAAAESSELLAVRKSCVLLLEELATLKPEIGAGVREEAVKVAAAWKKKVAVGASPLEVQGFLMLLNSYGLVGEFDSDEIVNLFENVAQRKPSVELFHSLGLSDKAQDFIQKLISSKKNIEAVRFIYEFKLVDKFAPIQLLQDHVKEAKNVTKTILKNPKSSLKEKDDATEKEQTALRSVIRCIEDYGLESEYPSESLKERIKVLKKLRKVRKKASTATAKQNPQPSQLSGKKRPFPNSTHHARAATTGAMPMPITIPKLYPRPPSGGSRNVLHHRPPPPEAGERMEYLIPSSMMAVPQPPASSVAAVDSQSISARSSAGTHPHHRGTGGDPRQYMYSYQPSSHYQQQQQSSSAQYSPRYHSSIIFDCPVIDTGPVASPSLAREVHSSNLTGYMPEAQRASRDHYGLRGSDAEHIDMLVERYRIREKPGQFGSSSWALTKAQEIHSNESPRTSSFHYFPESAYRMAANLGDRSVPSNGNLDFLSNGSYRHPM